MRNQDKAVLIEPPNSQMHYGRHDNGQQWSAPSAENF